jgi:hypothetical protein
VGQRYLAVATDRQNHTAFVGGIAALPPVDHYARLRQRHHRVRRRIVDAYPHSLMG